MAAKPYIPKSQNPYSLKTVVPENMHFEVHKAMDRISRDVGGNIDRFVAAKLQYPNVTEMYGKLAAEQIDVVAMAIYNLEKNEGCINSDMTGIGKGRTGAAIIRYCVINKIPCTFVTKTPELFSDMYRDMVDIGYEQAVPFIFNNEPKAELSVEIDNKVTNKIELKSAVDFAKNPKFGNFRTLAAQEAELSQSYNTLPDGYDFVMTTYSQLAHDNQAKKEKAEEDEQTYKPSKNKQYKTQFLREYMRGGIFIMDEAHVAGGSDSNVGYYVRSLVEQSKGTYYLSATFAKQPKNMPLYALKTVIKNANLSRLGLIQAFDRGGVAMQEIVASDLVAETQMIRRQRDYSANMFNYLYLDDKYEVGIYDEHRATYDTVINVVKQIIAFQKEFVTPTILAIGKSKGVISQEAISITKGTENGGIDNQDFVNKSHNLVSQLLFSLKAQAVAQTAIKLLNEDKKVVVAFKNTMETFLTELGIRPGDKMTGQDDFKFVLMKSLEGVMKYTVKIKGSDNETEILDFEEFSDEGKTEYNRLIEMIKTTTTGISISPIDVLTNTINATRKPSNIGGHKREFYAARECTGRKGNIVPVKNEQGQIEFVYKTFRADKKRFFSEFNNGEADVLLINQSASTGVSCHSSEKFKDKRQRTMMLHQPQLDIAEQQQILGRIYRSGMVEFDDNGKSTTPQYLYVSSMIPAERREFMILKRKLKSLDANTTGSARNSEDTLSETDDFFNKYGAAVIKNYLLDDNRNLLMDMCGGGRSAEDEKAAEEWLTGRKWKERKAKIDAKAEGKEVDKDEDAPETVAEEAEFQREAENTADEDLVRRVTNRISIQPVSVQEDFYNTILKLYTEKVEDLKMKGEYDLETEYLELDAKSLDCFLLAKGRGGETRFDRDAILEKCDVKVLKRPMRWSEVESTIKKNLGTETPDEATDYVLSELMPFLIQTAEKEKKEYKQDIENTKERITTNKEDIKTAQTITDKQIEIRNKKRKTPYVRADELKRAQDNLESNEIRLANEIKNMPFAIKKVDDYVSNFSTLVKKWATIGTPVVVCFEESVNAATGLVEKELRNGVIIGVTIPDDPHSSWSLEGMESQITVEVAIAGPERRIKKSLGAWRLYMHKYTNDTSLSTLNDIPKNWNNFDTADREEIYIGTRNIIKGFAAALKSTALRTPRLVKFVTHKKQIRNGILLKFAKNKYVNDLKGDALINKVKLQIGKVYDLKSHKVALRLEPFVNALMILVKQSKLGKPIYGDADIIALLARTPAQISKGEQGSFMSNGKEFSGNFVGANQQKVLDILADKYDVTLEAETLQGVKCGSDYDDEDGDVATSKPLLNWYELGEKFKTGIYPKTFVEYTPQEGTKYGVVAFSDSLSMEERLQFSLMPYFDNLESVVAMWDDTTDESVIKVFKGTFKYNLKNMEKSNITLFFLQKQAGEWLCQNAPQLSTTYNLEFYLGQKTMNNIRALGEAALKFYDLHEGLDLALFIQQLKIELAQ